MKTKEEIRCEFEAEARSQVSSISRGSNGMYLASDADAAWWAWQRQEDRLTQVHKPHDDSMETSARTPVKP